MSQQIEVPLTKRPRLQFIDLARTIAILLMLEGHFVDLTLGPEYRSPDARFVNPDFFYYDVWLMIRGYTSPMFLTMTGLVFVYLMYRDNAVSFWQNIRVRKGWERILLLLFWGYLLNPMSFHVLQCIGYGIFGILGIYGLYKLVRFIPLWMWYFTAGFITLTLWAPLDLIRDAKGEIIPWPIGAPEFIQNMIHNSNGALFPLAPNLGYTFIGAGLGAILHANWLHAMKWKYLLLTIVSLSAICTLSIPIIVIASLIVLGTILVKKENWNLPLFLVAFGILLSYYLFPLVQFLHYKVFYKSGISFTWVINSNWLYDTLGWVLMILALLAGLEKIVRIKDNLFLKVGQNTLSIFIVHMMILYGAVIQIGIRNFYSKARNPLDPYEAAFGAILFIITFVIMVKYLDPLSKLLTRFLKIIFPFLNRNL
jgi:hypothetical protein